MSSVRWCRKVGRWAADAGDGEMGEELMESGIVMAKGSLLALFGCECGLVAIEAICTEPLGPLGRCVVAVTEDTMAYGALACVWGAAE